MSRPESISWQDQLRGLLEAQGGYEPVAEPAAEAAGDHCARKKNRLTVVCERKGRAGKTATVISGFDLPDPDVAEIAAMLKKRLATGGSARGGEILVQGDRRDDVRRVLTDLGYRF